jgi:hypothetical protein
MNKKTFSQLLPVIHNLHAFTKNQCTILDGYCLNRKLFLTWSLSSMIYMPSQRISAPFWMDTGWTGNFFSLGGPSHPWFKPPKNIRFELQDPNLVFKKTSNICNIFEIILMDFVNFTMVPTWVLVHPDPSSLSWVNEHLCWYVYRLNFILGGSQAS